MCQDSGSQYKSPVLGLKGGLWVFRKTALDQYFLSYVKKKLQGGERGLSINNIKHKLASNIQKLRFKINFCGVNVTRLLYICCIC